MNFQYLRMHFNKIINPTLLSNIDQYKQSKRNKKKIEFDFVKKMFENME